LIDPKDKTGFASIIKATWQSFGRNVPDKETMAYWFSKLQQYELEEVGLAFDAWLLSQTELPTINEILKLCKPKVTIFARLPSPLAKEANKKNAEKFIEQAANFGRHRKDMRAWAKKIMGAPKQYPDISQKFAKEALGYEL
jgi:hypothetical protein